MPSQNSLCLNDQLNRTCKNKKAKPFWAEKKNHFLPGRDLHRPAWVFDVRKTYKSRPFHSRSLTITAQLWMINFSYHYMTAITPYSVRHNVRQWRMVFLWILFFFHVVANLIKWQSNMTWVGILAGHRKWEQITAVISMSSQIIRRNPGEGKEPRSVHTSCVDQPRHAATYTDSDAVTVSRRRLGPFPAPYTAARSRNNVLLARVIYVNLDASERKVISYEVEGAKFHHALENGKKNPPASNFFPPNHIDFWFFTWYSLISRDTLWFHMILFDFTWYSLISHDTLWFWVFFECIQTWKSRCFECKKNPRHFLAR